MGPEGHTSVSRTQTPAEPGKRPRQGRSPAPGRISAAQTQDATGCFAEVGVGVFWWVKVSSQFPFPARLAEIIRTVSPLL